jgi:hypothetical protein
MPALTPWAQKSWSRKLKSGSRAPPPAGATNRSNYVPVRTTSVRKYKML